MPNNPYVLTFGTEPTQYISRPTQTGEILDSFCGEPSSSHVYMITGVRGSGKTVMLSSIASELSEREGWIVVNVTPDTDILMTVAAKLYSRPELMKLFINAKLDFSAFGLGVSIEKGKHIFDIGTALESMLKELSKKKKKVLITIDEVVKNEYVKLFCSTFQLLLREKLPVYLIMTGLYENIHNLQNEKTLTFLYRAPKVTLDPLSVGAIARNYASVLKVDTDLATEMAKLTKGYPFAYQVLGYLCFKELNSARRTIKLERILPEYDQMLEEYVYEKIWSELSAIERDVVVAASDSAGAKVQDIIKSLSIPSNKLSVYRDRLKKKGIINTSVYGRISLALPRFGEIIRFWTE